MGSFLGEIGGELVVGLVGGLVVSFAFWLTRRASDWRLQRRFPVAGNYISRFEDLIGGELVVVTAPAVLEQRGKRVSGSTTLDDREWILQGDLSDSGYVHGIYYAKDPIDKGIGNFFVRVHNDRKMEGLWSGFDSVNGLITSGRYSFRPVEEELTVRPALRSDAAAVLRIADEQLGVGYVNESGVLEAEESDSRFAYVAVAQGHVVGFALCARQSLTEASESIRSRLPRHLRFAQSVGVLKTIAITRRLQGRGVGTKLAAACLDEFQRQDIPAVYSVAWKSGNHINVSGVLERLGFVPFAEVPDYWREDSLRDDFACPECGEPPCSCSAVMYSLVLG